MLVRTLYSYNATQCLYVAAKLNIADHLLAGSAHISKLAEVTHSNMEALYRVLRCLVALDIFKEDSFEHFSLNENAKQLLSNTESSLKNFVILCGEELYQSSGNLCYSVQTGLPSFNHIYGMSYWDYLEKNPAKAEIFHNAMEKGSQKTINNILDHYDFSQYKSVVDVGGGKGHFVATILSKYPDIRGTVYDLKSATELAAQYINKRSLADRCTISTGNFFESVPRDGDIYLLKIVLHDWDDENALLILKNCRDAASKTSKLLIVEKVVEDNNYQDSTCLGDINMLVVNTGKERTLQEFEKLLNRGGFTLTKKIKTDTAFSIIEAMPV